MPNSNTPASGKIDVPMFGVVVFGAGYVPMRWMVASNRDSARKIAKEYNKEYPYRGKALVVRLTGTISYKLTK